MKNIFALLFVFSISLAFSARPAMAQQRGIQAVLLDNWDRTSVDKLGDVLSRGRFTVSACPYLSPKNKRFQNLTRLVASVGRKNEIIVVVHLSFHSHDSISSTSYGTRDSKEIRRRAEETAQWAERMHNETQGRSRVFICPMLEDEWDEDEALRALTDVAEAGNKFVRLLRTPICKECDLERPAVSNRSGEKVQVALEWHGTRPGSKKPHFFSNDGVFVYDPVAFQVRKDGKKMYVQENATSFPNADGSHKGALSLSDFSKIAHCNTLLLWRPAYNGNGNEVASVVAQPSTKTPIVQYHNTKFSKRNFRNVLNAHEQNILEAFLLKK